MTIDERRKYHRDYYHKHSVKLNAQAKEHRQRQVKDDPDYYKKYYAKNKERLLGYQRKWNEKHREAINKQKRDYHKNNLEKDRLYRYEHHLKKSYGMSLEDKKLLLEQQNNVCKTCASPLIHTEKKCCVDHDHKTGRVRGILCSNCNIVLGMIKENTITLSNMIEYIRS